MDYQSMQAPCKAHTHWLSFIPLDSLLSAVFSPACIKIPRTSVESKDKNIRYVSIADIFIILLSQGLAYIIPERAQQKLH